MPPALPGLVAALGIGLLIGLERERRREDDPQLPAGIRSFTLIALAGAVAYLLGTVAIAVSGAFVGLAAAAAFWRSSPQDPGVTTEVAMLVTWLLGVLAGSEPALAVGLGVAVAVILAGKSRMHQFAQRVLTTQELHDLLLLAARLEDADTLFFHRRLQLTGDVELGLAVRNLLDQLPWEAIPLGLRVVLNRGARFARAARDAHRAA